jgi:hypothetical protein
MTQLKVCWADRNWICEVYAENKCEEDCPVRKAVKRKCGGKQLRF